MLDFYPRDKKVTNKSLTNKHIFLITLVLTIIAAIPRFYELGSLGFYGDEETTSLPSRSLAQGNDANMPSGMPYRRALPHTWANSLTANIFGLEKELSYRVPSAILGTLTIPILFLLIRSFLGTSAALLAALLLALSEWHIITSREARMYVPFLFFYISATFFLWRWITHANWRNLLLATILSALAISLHPLGMLLGAYILIPIAFSGWSRISWWWLLAYSALVVFSAHLYSNYFSLSAYDDWKNAQGGSIETTTSSAAAEIPWLPDILITNPLLTVLCMLIGAGVGIWLARLCHPKISGQGSWLIIFAHYSLAAITGLLASIGQLYGVAISATLFLILYPNNKKVMWDNCRIPIAVLALLASIWSAAALMSNGIMEGIKILITLPFPYAAYFAEVFPGVFVLFLATCAYLALNNTRYNEYPLRAMVLATILPIAAIGAVSRWGGIRYIIEAYPFLLILAAVALAAISRAIFHRSRLKSTLLPTTAAIIIVLSGVLGSHGIPQATRAATMEYGKPINAHILGFPFYPDHQGAGQFVRKQLHDNDLVVAEDALQQNWYIGRVDYWLRDYVSSSNFLYKNLDGSVRDIYVNSRILTPDTLLSITRNNHQRIWVITSGETVGKHDDYLNQAQRDWLNDLEMKHSPKFTGRDGKTLVYCLHC